MHVEVIEAWSGHGRTKALREELPALVRQVKPRVPGWFPAGPAAAVAAALPKKKARRDVTWPPRGVELMPLTAETTAMCLGLAEQVKSGENSQSKPTRGSAPRSSIA
ncbi:hypothetical protein [Amycolatopsis sp. w19]|uniref:hypothetical protein n=1 Tax=Amycolatopsis sp. w19 TaxID=3448134 RepID=UPI003F1BDED8